MSEIQVVVVFVDVRLNFVYKYITSDSVGDVCESWGFIHAYYEYITLENVGYVCDVSYVSGF